MFCETLWFKYTIEVKSHSQVHIKVQCSEKAFKKNNKPKTNQSHRGVSEKHLCCVFDVHQSFVCLVRLVVFTPPAVTSHWLAAVLVKHHVSMTIGLR